MELMNPTGPEAVKHLRVHYLVVLGIGIIVLAGLAIAFVNKALTPQGLGVAFLVFAIGLSTAFYLIFRRMSLAVRDVDRNAYAVAPAMDSAARKRTVRQIGRLRFMVALFVFCLFFALWEERHGPYVPLLVGCVINLVFTTGMVLAIRRLQKNLE
jgi:hypothetical protein